MKTVVEINGRKYDLRTGEIQNGESPMVATRAVPVPTTTTRSFIDGVNRRKPQPPIQVPTPAPNSAKPSVTPLQPAAASRSIDIIPARRKAERAKTLIRGVVKKPHKNSPQIHGTSTIPHSTVERSATGRGVLLKRIPESRLARAKHTTKSLNIRRFGTSAQHDYKPKLSSELAVTKEPLSVAVPPAAPVIMKPALGKHDTQQQVFHHTIAQATHHTSAKVKKAPLHHRVAQKLRINPRIVSIGAASIAVLVLVSFLAYQNIPAVAMKVAASKAGFSGHLPGDTPAGFAFKGPIRYEKGAIAVQFNSNTDDRSFILLQKPSDWTSDSLLTNYVLSNSTRYQTYHSNGLTVFIYNNGDATWVDKGVWYSLNGNGALSADQILTLAASM